MVKSFSDFISIAFCNIFSNIAAAVATTTAIKVVRIQMARKPAGSSSLLCDTFIKTPAIAIKILSTIAQYFMLFKAFTEFDENTLFCPIYPKLKVYLMHAGENFYENTLRMMDGYPNLYADLGVEMWLHPITKDFAVKFLKSAKDYGFLDRVMFGSDQMVWPEAITSSITFLAALDFLTKEEKQKIFYDNAKRFLGIKE